MAKKIFLVLAVILVIVCAGLFYVNKVLLPVQIKGMIIKSAEEQLHRQVTFNELYYHPIKGVVITGFTVASKEKPGEPMLSVPEASARVMLWPLLKKQVIVSSVHIDSPALRLVRFEPELWSFSDMLQPAQPAAPKKAGEKPPFSLVISGISVSNGRVQVTDLARGDEFTETIEAIELHGSVALNTSLRISGSLTVPGTQGFVKVNALYTFKDKSFKGDLTAGNLQAARYLRFAPPLPLAVRDLAIAEADLKISGNDQTATVTGNAAFPALDLDPAVGSALKTSLTLQGISVSISRDGTIALQGGVSAAGLTARSSDGISAEGDLKASVAKLVAAKGGTEFSGSLEAGNLQIKLGHSRSLGGNLRLHAAAVSLKDGRLSASGDLEVNNLDLRLDNDLLIKGDLSAKGFSVDPAVYGMNLKGEVKLAQAILSTAQGQTISGDFFVSRPVITIEGANVSGQADLAVKELKVTLPNLSAESEISAPGTTFALQNGVTEIAARLELNELHAAVAPDISVTAPASTYLAVNLKNDPAARQPLAYSGTLDLSGLDLAGLPTVDKVTGLTGKIEFETDRARTPDLALSVWDTPVKVSGEISDFKAPRVDLDIKIDQLDVELLGKALPAVFQEQGIRASGTGSGINAHIEGSLADMAKAKVRGRAELKDVTVESAKLKQKAEKVSGLITYDPPTLSWKDLHVGHQGRDYLLNGHLQDFANPAVAGSLKTADLLADYQVKKQGDRIGIEKLSGSYFGSTFALTGTVQLEPNAEPSFAVKGEVKLALEDLPQILPADKSEQLKALKLNGTLKIKADIKGSPADWTSWTSDVIIDTAKLGIMGYEVQDLRVSAKQQDGQIAPLTVDGDFYEGVIHAETKVELTKSGFPFQTAFKLDSTDLEKLKKVTPMKDRRLKGILTCTADLSGTATDTKGLKGTASFAIKEGYLFDMPGLSLLASILQASAKVGDITALNAASATMQFQDGRGTTDDLHIKGPAVDIHGKGWVSLDQAMDMTFKTTFITASTSGSAMNVLSVIDATGATGELTGVRIYGPLSNPKKEFQALNPAKVIPNVIKNTADNILKLFQ